MGISTDGQLCYGVKFEEDYEFPWEDEDIDDWWLIESGWKWDGEEPFTPEGEYAPGFGNNDPRIEEYFRSRHLWLRDHPCPIVEVNYQSGDYPAYILAAPSTVITARRGYPERIDPLVLRQGEDIEGEFNIEVEALEKFLRKYDLFIDEPAWWLSSYYG